MKIIRFTLLVALVGIVSTFFVAPTASAAGEVKLYVSPASSNQTTGGQFDVVVRVGKASPDRVDYASVGLAYPTSKLEVVSVNGGGTAFNRNGTWLSSINAGAGIVHLSGESDALANPSDVVVATVKFRSKTAGRADLGFTGDSAVGDLFGPGKVKNYLTSTAGAAITVSDPPVPGTTFPTTRPAAPAPVTQPDETPADMPIADEQSISEADRRAQDGAGTAREPASEAMDDTGTQGLVTRYGWIAGTAITIITLAALMILKLVKMHRASDANPVVFGEGLVSRENDASFDVTPGASEKEWPLLNSTLVAEDDESLEAAVLQQAEEIQSIELNPIPEQLANLEQLAEETQMRSADTQSLPVESTVIDTPDVQPIVNVMVPEPTVVQPAVVPAPAPPEELPMQLASPAPTQPTVASTATDDIPDMFEVGEARLREQGYVSNVPPRPRV